MMATAAGTRNKAECYLLEALVPFWRHLVNCQQYCSLHASIREVAVLPPAHGGKAWRIQQLLTCYQLLAGQNQEVGHLHT